MADVKRDLWLRRYQPAPHSEATLVCLPHAGGSASFYLPVARALAPHVEVLAVQYPGRQDRRRERCIDDVRVLAERIVEPLRASVDRPLALFGHSMGATVGFELALLLEQRLGIVPRALFVSGRRAPSRHRHETVHQRSDEALLEELLGLGGTSTQVFGDDEIVRMILPAMRADYTAAETYVYREGPALQCPVTVFVGRDDPKVTHDEAQAWKEHTSGAFALHEFAGGHFYLTEHQGPINTVILDQLTSSPDGR